ncbi:hypothetical protein GCM10017674_77900 [Streptomyces gardneri]|uniref:Uncharacterized protein n=1 Tax=Streptomyces gardneri TaxID=66892 RepID=A0A4Y3RUB4_9ACTN|nr:hypothetical protein SGA01_69010 [Streptomyces gardneri]GHH22265.1 hypothetical protein GCM10017674_77900 [Streptomyces gardneri]
MEREVAGEREGAGEREVVAADGRGGEERHGRIVGKPFLIEKRRGWFRMSIRGRVVIKACLDS